MKFLAWLCLLIAVPLAPASAQKNPYRGDLSNPSPEERAWVDRTYEAMTEDQRIGQLMMIRAHSNRPPEHVAAVKKLITDYHVGGLCFFQGDPVTQVKLTNEYQGLAELPLMISMDAEWGIGMRLPDQTISFPKQLALGAIQDNGLIYEMGQEIARQFHRMGMHVSFSPVLDVNNNPNNPVIATRSFGEDRYNVTSKGYAYMRGLQDHGIMASAKHFPGHGDTDVDSHYDLPVISHDRARLDSIELYPFQSLVRYGIGSMMAAHLQIPALDDRPNRPSSLSKPIITDLLRKEMGFTGIVFTDGLEMKGVTKHYGDGEVEAEAIAAGSDIMLLPESTPLAFEAIKRYVREGKISPGTLEAAVRRVLLSKYRLGLTQRMQPVPTENLVKDLNTPRAKALKQRLFEAAMTLVRDEENLVPIGPLEDGKLVSLRIGPGKATTFTERLDNYGRVRHLAAGTDPGQADRNRILSQLKEDDLVIASLYSDGSRFIEKVPISAGQLSLLRQVDERCKLIITMFGNPYSLDALDGFGTVMVGYTRDDVAQDAGAQALFGANRISGRLPVTASPSARFNAGKLTSASLRMGYAPPERVGIDGDRLERLADNHAREAIRAKATPGMVVLVAREGKIVFEKAYGHHTYTRNRPVKTSDVYDLASLTKVAATSLAIMKLVDEGKVGLDVPLREYLPELIGTNKEFLTLRPILAHRAGLRSWIPFYAETMNANGKPSSQIYRTQRTGNFQIPVTQNLYMHTAYRDSIWQKLYDSPLPNEGQYRYSDLGFYLIAKIVDEVSGMPLNEFVRYYFYEPMGLETLTFRPLSKIPVHRIPPSEKDTYFRKRTVQGTVHDMGAAMLGGVSGHAGLFGSAHDLAAVFQMLLQEGNYGGFQYLRPETVRLFTNRYPGETRRALGFDMKQLNENRRMNMSPLASDRAFGHLGFTGIAAWADPVEDLVYIFLSNRTFPSMNNSKLGRMDTRVKMHSAAYEAIEPEASYGLLGLPPFGRYSK